MEFLKKHSKDIIYVGVTVLLCLNLDWSWSNFKSFVTGGVIVLSLFNRFSEEDD